MPGQKEASQSITPLSIALKKRNLNLTAAQNKTWHTVVIGAGITGAQTFRILAEKGFDVLIVDANDFSSGTSSNSGMLIWGGLLYLKNLNFKSVFRFSKSRDKLIKNDSENLKVLSVIYLTDAKNILIKMALWIYWLFSLCRRKHPSHPIDIDEQSFLKRRFKFKSVFEEALLNTSDSRYVVNILLSVMNQNRKSEAFNYLELLHNQNPGGKWGLVLKDKIGDQVIHIKTKHVINCCGVYTSEVHARLGLETPPYRHLWSKGVYLNLVKNPTHRQMLIFDDPHVNDVQTFCPVKKVSLFGPTEDNIDKKRHKAMQLTRDDIAQLRDKFELCTGNRLTRDAVISYRLGVRPLCVARQYSATKHTLSLSRNSKVHFIKERDYCAVFGGKFTGSYNLARKTVKRLGIKNVPKEQGMAPLWKKEGTPKTGDHESESGDVVAPDQAILNEQCWTLRDYLRHRTFIHQSEANGGFGFAFCHKEEIRVLSSYFLDKIGSSEVSYKAYYQEQKDLNTLFEEVLNE